jgi:hypothetical protein
MKKIVITFLLLFSFFILSPPMTIAATNCLCYVNLDLNTDASLKSCVNTTACNSDSDDPNYIRCEYNLTAIDKTNCEQQKPLPANTSCSEKYTCVSNIVVAPPLDKTDTAGGTTTPATGTTEKASGAVSDTAPTAFPLNNPLGADNPDINVLVGRVIKYLIGIAGTATLIVFIYGGILWLTARGEAANVDKGKSAMGSAVIGLIILFSSYVIVKFIYAALISASA